MIKIGIYGREFNEKYDKDIRSLFLKLKEKGFSLFIYDKFFDFLKSRSVVSEEFALFNSEEPVSGKVDIMMSIGGDGTLLDTLAFVKNSDVPIIGVNTGRLGFLSAISIGQIDEALEALNSGDYNIDKRNLLRLETPNNVFNNLNYALNELTLHKKDSASMMTIHAYLNGEFLNTYWADGLIVSTPTGSTAYSLSCGGPIIIPGSENFIITPIAPHNLNVRPIVLPSNNIITLKIEGRSKNYLVSLDSRTESIDPAVELTIRKADFKVSLIRLRNQNFLSTLRNKLMWGLDLRN
jgi:NAD+ kinase